MPYIEPAQRRGMASASASRLMANTDFQTICDCWLSDLTDKQDEILTADGTPLSRAQGAAVELRRLLDEVFTAGTAQEKLAMIKEMRAKRGRDMFFQPAVTSMQA
jgi:hypothetical protein